MSGIFPLVPFIRLVTIPGGDIRMGGNTGLVRTIQTNSIVALAGKEKGDKLLSLLSQLHISNLCAPVVSEVGIMRVLCALSLATFFVLASERPMKSMTCTCNEASGFFSLCIFQPTSCGRDVQDYKPARSECSRTRTPWYVLGSSTCFNISNS